MAKESKERQVVGTQETGSHLSVFLSYRAHSTLPPILRSFLPGFALLYQVGSYLRQAVAVLSLLASINKVQVRPHKCTLALALQQFCFAVF